MARNRLVSLVRTADEKREAEERAMSAPIMPSLPDVPYGLQICLCGPELDKMGIELDGDVKVGDILHIKGFIEVTGIVQRSTAGMPDEERLEGSVTHLQFLENESTEGEDDDEEGE